MGHFSSRGKMIIRVLRHHQWLALGLIPVDAWQPNHLLQKQDKTPSGRLEEQLKQGKQWSLITVAALYKGVVSRSSHNIPVA